MWCVDYIEEWVLNKFVPPEEVAAILVEPIAGEGGYIHVQFLASPGLAKRWNQGLVSVTDEETFQYNS